MTTETQTISLADFGADSVWFVSVGIPTGVMVEFTGIVDDETGETYNMEPHDRDNAIPFGWDLEGTVNDAGEWCWDGEGIAHDWNRNTVTAIKAFR